MFDVNNFLSIMKSVMKPETIYIKEVDGLVVVFYKHYKENSVFMIIKNKNEVSVFRNGNNILSFEIENVKKGIRTLNDMLNSFAVYVAINYDSKKTIKELKDSSASDTIDDSFDGLFWVDDDDIDITLIRFDIKKEWLITLF